MLPLKHSGNAVVQQAESKEQIIKTCEDNKEVVEGVLHILAGQNVNGKTVPDQAEGCHDSLEICIRIIRRVTFLLIINHIEINRNTKRTPSIQYLQPAIR